MARRWKGSTDKELREVLKFFTWQPAINFLPTSVNQGLQRVKLGFLLTGFPGGTSGKEPACQCRRYKRHGFHPWIRKIPLEECMATPSSMLIVIHSHKLSDISNSAMTVLRLTIKIKR